MQTIPTIDLYRELEVDPAASTETIDAAWKSLLKRHHPDVTADAAVAHERVKRLNLAHEWLSDPQRRALYDRSRRSPGVVVVPRPPQTQPGRPRPAPPARQPDTRAAGSRPAGGAPPHNPYAEYDLPNRPGPTPSTPPPGPASVRPVKRRMSPLVLPLALLSVLAVIAGSSYVASMRSGGSAASTGPAGASAAVAGPGSSAASGVPDPRTLPAPNLAADVPASCRPTNLARPYSFETAAGGATATVYVVRCQNGQSAGPLLYVASSTGWRLAGKLGFHAGTPFTAVSGAISGRSPDEFGIAWSADGGATTTITLYRATSDLVAFWDSETSALAWSLPRITWQAGADAGAPGTLVVVWADLGTGTRTCTTCADHQLYRGVYAWDTTIPPAGLRLQGQREAVGVGLP